MKSRQGKTFASRSIKQCIKMVTHRFYKLRRCEHACQSQQALSMSTIAPESRILKRVMLRSYNYICFNHVKA